MSDVPLSLSMEQDTLEKVMIYLTHPKHQAASKRRQRKAKERDKRFNKKEGTTNAGEQNGVYCT